MVPKGATHHSQKRVGLYAWAGPDTIRMTRLKYGEGSKIDEQSFLTLYDPAPLRHVRSALGVTDMWVTYSWGFGDAAESEQRAFLRSKLPHFHDAGIATHAYVQGFNVVSADFASREFFCRDARGNCLPYSRGRSLICPNAPETRKLLLERVDAASNEAVDGVFVDNMLFGVPPVAVYRDFLPPFGCMCNWCTDAFRRFAGTPMPMNGWRGEESIGTFLRFRAASVADVIGACASAVRAKGKQFGVNLYDPLHHTPELYFGYGLASMEPHIDYRLIENHALRDGTMENTHLAPIINDAKPTFVVSYRKGIGRDGAYGQSDINAITADADALGYAPCIKASEYITHGTWHALRWQDVERPSPTTHAATPSVHDAPRVPSRSSAWSRLWTVTLGTRLAAALATALAWTPARKLIVQSPLYTAMVLRKRRFAAEIWGLA